MAPPELATIVKGTYKIAPNYFEYEGRLATIVSTGTPVPSPDVVVLDPSDVVEEQEVEHGLLSSLFILRLSLFVYLQWEIEQHTNKRVTIRNVKSDTYISYVGKAELDKVVVGTNESREWVLYKTTQEHHYQ